MNWLESDGGPILSLPTHRLSLWPGGPGAEYDLVCSIRDYAGVVPWEERPILVFGDQTFRTAVVRTMPFVCIVRWVHARSESDLMHAVDRFEVDAQDPVEQCIWKAADAVQSLVDGSASGKRLENQLRYELAPGRHEVRTYDVESDPSTSFIYHVVAPVA